MSRDGTIEDFIINLDKEPRTALVTRFDDPVKLPLVTENDIVTYRLWFNERDPKGGIKPVELAEGSHIRFGARVRLPVGQVDLFKATDWELKHEGEGDNETPYYEGKVYFNTVQMQQALEGRVEVPIYLNIEVLDDLSDPERQRTVVYVEGRARKDMANSDVAEIIDLSGFRSAQEVPKYLYAVTELEGIHETSLAGQSTQGLTLPRLYITFIPQAPRMWQLREGSEEHDPLNGFVRPTDFDPAKPVVFQAIG